MDTQQTTPNAQGGGDSGEPEVTESPRPYVDHPRTPDWVEPWDDIQVSEGPAPPSTDATSEFKGVFTRSPDGALRSLLPVVREQRFLGLVLPAEVAVNVPFEVVVSLALNPSGRRSTDLGLLSIPAGGMTVTVALSANQAVRLEGPSTVHAKLLPGKDLVIKLAVTALAVAPLGLEVRVFAAGGYLGDIAGTVLVAGSRGTSTQSTSTEPVEVEVGVGMPVAGSTTLSIHYDRVARQHTFELSSAHSVGLWAANEASLSVDLTRMTEQITNTLNALARGVIAPDLVPRYLRSIGALLWEQGMPWQIRDALARQPEGTRLTMVSSQDQLPWELVWSEGFLADRLKVNRWLYGMGPPPLNIGMGHANYVLPTQAPTRARSEVDKIARLYPSQQLHWSTVRELLDGIDRATFGMLHLAAHNTAVSTPAGSYISLDQPFDQLLLLDPSMVGRMNLRRPLVFLNACGSAASAPGWYQTTTWADLFVKVGAGAFVGSLWEVRDVSASPFAEAFYSATHRGESLEDAFQAARQTITDQSDPTRLAYTLYGHPDARLATK